MTDKKPHLLIFNPDQWRGDVLGHMGNPAVQTPDLDRFAAEDAVSFRNAFCQNPVCTPSRCSFMSGWYPHVRGHRTMSHMLHPDGRAGAVEDAQGERLLRVVGRQERPDPRSGWVRRILRREVRARRTGRLDVAHAGRGAVARRSSRGRLLLLLRGQTAPLPRARSLS